MSTIAEGATILIVDDDEDALHLLRMVMERSGYTVHSCTHGLEAVALAEAHAEEIEAIILDLMMPGDLDGYAVCDHLKDDLRTAHIPIIVLSAKSSARDMMRSYAAGAFQHITKPYDIQYLITVVDSMVRFRRLEREALQNAEKYRAIFDNSPLEMAVLTPAYALLEANAVFRRHHPELGIGDDVRDLFDPPETRDRATTPVPAVLRDGEPHREVVETQQGGKTWYRKVHAAPVKGEDGGVAAVVCIREDVTETRELEDRLRRQIERHNRALRHQDMISDHLIQVQKELQQNQRELERKSLQLEQANAELERLSITDALTGIYNRRHFDEVLENEVRRSQRYHHPLSLLMADIDHFKEVNDTHGHPVGDRVLHQVAQAFLHELRETDTVARYGGEEFAAILPETPAETALQIAERVRERIAGICVEEGGGEIRVTISLGVTTAEDGNAEAQDLVDTADAGLYEAKSGGRNRTAVASLSRGEAS